MARIIILLGVPKVKWPFHGYVDISGAKISEVDEIKE